MKILLTGSTGFVGRNLLLSLLKSGKYQEIWAPVRSPEKLGQQLKEEGFSEIPSSLRVFQTEGPHWDFTPVPEVNRVVHAAAILSGQNRDEYFQMNVEGTRRIFQQLPAQAKVVVLSSLAAAGPCPEGVDCRLESHESLPVTWYGESKLAMEKMLEEEFSGRSYLCLRPPLVLGPRDSASLPLFKMAKQIVRFKPGFTPKRYSYVSVSDLVAAIEAALEGEWEGLGQRVFFVGADETVTDAALISESARALEKMGWTLPIPHGLIWGISRVVDQVPAWRKAIPNLSIDRARDIWPERWVISAEPFKKQFGWTHKKAIPELLKETGEWYRTTRQL